MILLYFAKIRREKIFGHLLRIVTATNVFEGRINRLKKGKERPVDGRKSNIRRVTNTEYKYKYTPKDRLWMVERIRDLRRHHKNDTPTQSGRTTLAEIEISSSI